MIYEVYSCFYGSHDVEKSYGYYDSLVDLIADFILLDREILYAKVVVGVDEFNEFSERVSQTFD